MKGGVVKVWGILNLRLEIFDLLYRYFHQPRLLLFWSYKSPSSLARAMAWVRL